MKGRQRALVGGVVGVQPVPARPGIEKRRPQALEHGLDAAVPIVSGHQVFLGTYTDVVRHRRAPCAVSPGKGRRRPEL